MNRYSNVFETDEYAALNRSPRWVKLAGKCPTCKDEGEYTYNGITYTCEKDYDGKCIAFKLGARYEIARIPHLYQRLAWDMPFAGIVQDTVDEYVEALPNAIENGLGFYVWSKGLGSGKTFIECHILMEAIKAGYKALFVPFFDLVGLHNMTDEAERAFIEDRLMNADIIAIDDVIPGMSDKQIAHFGTSLERVIRHRVHNALSTIVTTNLAMHEMEDDYARIFSLLKSCSIPLDLAGYSDTRVESGITNVMRRLLNGETSPIV